MRSTRRRIDPGLIDQLITAPQRFEFFQAVRILERTLARKGRRNSDEAASELIRFRNSTVLAFSPSQLESLEVRNQSEGESGDGDDRESVEITPSFIGLLGIHGTMPAHYSERVAEWERLRRDGAARAFFDLFSNRAVGNFYRAWKKYRLAVCYEQDRRQHFLPLVLALAGLGFDGLKDRFRAGGGAIDDEALARFAGVLRQRPLSATGLQDVLTAYLRVPTRVEQFVGKWYPIPLAQRSTLGGNNALLGKNALLGERVWQLDLRIRIWIGPVDMDAYEAFLPGGECAAALEKLLSFATGHHFEYEVRPILRSVDVRATKLGGDHGARLGFDSFMITRPAQSDRCDPVFELQPLY